MPNKLKQKSSFLFKWNIWKVVHDFQLPLTALELRDPEARQVQIVVINHQTNQQLPFNLLHLEWWSTLAGMNKGCFVVQDFKESKFPEPKGFVVYNALEEKMVIQDENAAFAYFANNQIITSRIAFDKIIYEAFDLDTGKKEELSADSLKNLTPEEAKISLPLQYNEGNNHFNTVKRFIENCNNKEAVLGVEYLEIKSFIIVSYYIRGLGQLQNFLLLTDLEGTVIEDILLSSDLKGISGETFFIKDNHLYFIKNKKELLSYEL